MILFAPQIFSSYKGICKFCLCACLNYILQFNDGFLYNNCNLLYTLYLHFIAFSCLLYSSFFYMPFTLLSSFSLYFQALMTYHSLIATFMIYCSFSFCSLFIYENILFFQQLYFNQLSLCPSGIHLECIQKICVAVSPAYSHPHPVSLKQQFLFQPKNYWLRPAVCHKIFYMTPMLCPSSSISCRLLKIFSNILILKSINFRVIRRKGLCNYSV